MWKYFQDKKDDFYRRIMRPIPSDFLSFETGGAFDTCVECEGSLSGDSADYIIEKSYQDGEVIYEYALCGDCCKSMKGEMSKESTKHLKKSLKRPILKTTIDGCRCCGIPKHELPSYTIVGSCLGNDMIFWNVPVLICEPCLETISEGLSKQTRDMLDDFEQRNFPGPPEFEIDLPQPRKKVVLI